MLDIIQMKKIPSYPKITAKTNITVTQTQNININSPKALPIKKGFKPEQRKIKPTTQILRNDSSATLFKPDPKLQDLHRKSSKKISKEYEQEKTIKNSKSQRELMMLSEKLKRLEEKIKVIKTKEKMEKNSSISNRSLSRNREGSNYHKKQSSSSRKHITQHDKISRNNSTKMLKKSYSDKIGIRLPQSAKNKKKVSTNSQAKNSTADNIQSLAKKEQHDKEVLHQFLTQVPNTHVDAHLKEGVEESLKNRTYELSESDSDRYDENEAYYVGKAERSLSKPALYAIREHLFQSLQTMQFLQNIRRPSPQEISKKFINLPPSKFQHTVILDLDETLIHCNETLTLPHDVKLTIKFPMGQKIDAGVNIRPFAREFLEQLSTVCEVIVFTASHECYANVVLDYLDPHKKYISQRLFREHCWQTEQGIYIKDLRVIRNRELDNLVLVDNAAYSYYFQLANGIPIIPFYDEKSDKELPLLLNYLKQMIAVAGKEKSSIKSINSRYFQLDQYSKYEDITLLIEELYHHTEEEENIRN